MGHLVVLRHLWLTLPQLPDKEKVPLLDALTSPQGLSGPVMEQMREKFEATQKSAEAPKTFLPRCKASTAPAPPPPAASPCSSRPTSTSTSPAPSPVPEFSQAARRFPPQPTTTHTHTLADCLIKWQVGSSDKEHDYELQFGQAPPAFAGVKFTTVAARNANWR